jgi:hypothetical protein
VQTDHPIILEVEDCPIIIVNDKNNKDNPINVDHEDIEGRSAIEDDDDDNDSEDEEYQPTVVDDEDYPPIVDDDEKKDDVSRTRTRTRTRQQRDDPDKTLYTNAEDELKIKNNLLRCRRRISRRYEKNKREMKKVEEYLAILGR